MKPDMNIASHRKIEVADGSAAMQELDFEQAYRRHEFSELVRVILIAADWFGRRLRKPTQTK